MQIIDTSKFIQQIHLPIIPDQKTIHKNKIEPFLLTLLKKGLGIWKEHVGEFPKIVIEVKKNTIEKELLEEIQNHKEDLFNYLDENKKYYPLSSSQEMMCLQTELFKNSSYQLAIPFYINYVIEKDIFIKSLKKVIERHPILRTIFPKIQHQWAQIVLPSIRPDVNFIDLSHSSIEAQRLQVASILDQEKLERLSIGSPPLFKIKLIKVNQKKFLIIINSHHAIFDGISYPIFMHELMTVYQALEQHKTSNLPDLKGSYSDFVLDQKGITEEIKKSEIDWWKQQLENCPVEINFPKAQFLSKEKSRILSFNFSEASTKNFSEFCKKINVSITLFFFGGIFILLNRFTRQNDLIIGTVLNQRNRLEYENLIGDFNNVIPMRMKINDAMTGTILIKQVQTLFFDAFSHQKVTFNELVSQLNIKRNKNNLTFYNVFFDSLNLDAFQRNFSEDHIELPTKEDIQARILPLMDLFFLLIQKSDQLSLLCSFNKKIFTEKIIHFLFKNLETILNNLVQEPNRSIGSYLKISKYSEKGSIFCIPGADGQIDIFQRITHQIQPYDCYAIKYKDSNELKNISEIANNFINVITNNLKSDSVLMGLSTGGVIAFEMMHQFSKSELNKLTKLVLLDPPTLNDYHKIILNKEFILVLVMNYAQKMFELVTEINPENFISKLTELTTDQKVKTVYDWIKENTQIIIPSFKSFQQWLNLLERNISALKTYEPKPYLGHLNVYMITSSSNQNPLSLLYPTLKNSESTNKLDFWKKLLPNCTIQTYIVPDTNHYSLFTKQNVKILQTILTNLLDQEGDQA